MEKMNAALVLEDGTVFQGKGFGAQKQMSGEVVFNTGMVGYTESITDPSYKGQILCQTYPLIGNYGVCESDFESSGPKIEGYIVSQLCDAPSHYTSSMSLNDWLEREGIPGIQGIDTRALTQKLRAKGVMLGILKTSKNDIDVIELKEQAKKIKDPNSEDLVMKVTEKKVSFYEPKKKLGTIVAIDAGIKNNSIRSFVQRGMRVVRVPANAKVDSILGHKPDGVFISNGPGDPAKVPYLIEACMALLESKVPLMGICLGNQILAHALGGSTYKLKFGHRGQNHPVIDLKTGSCFMTSQNHGFAVDFNSMKDGDAAVTHTHANDRSVEGIESKNHDAFSVQWHPEHAPGPMDTIELFDRFIKRCLHG